MRVFDSMLFWGLVVVVMVTAFFVFIPDRPLWYK